MHELNADKREYGAAAWRWESASALSTRSLYELSTDVTRSGSKQAMIVDGFKLYIAGDVRSGRTREPVLLYPWEHRDFETIPGNLLPC